MGVDPDELLEQVAALRHDLGKYVAWISANLEEQAWSGPVSDDLLSALRRDILRTRSGAADEAAWEVWERLTRGFPRPLVEPELREVEAAVAELRRVEGPLRAGDREALAGARTGIRAAQQTIRAALQRLHRRLQQARRG